MAARRGGGLRGGVRRCWCGVEGWLMAKLRRVAMFSGLCPVRIVEASSRKAMSRTKWSLFSVTQCAPRSLRFVRGRPDGWSGR